MLQWTMGVIARVGIAAIVLTALIVARSITKPINRITVVRCYPPE